MIQLSAQINPKSKEVLSYCQEFVALDTPMNTQEADTIVAELIETFGMDAVLDAITRRAA